MVGYMRLKERIIYYGLLLATGQTAWPSTAPISAVAQTLVGGLPAVSLGA